MLSAEPANRTIPAGTGSPMIAYLLAVLGGNPSPICSDLKDILTSAGMNAPNAHMKKLIADLNGKNIEEVVAAGNSWILCNVCVTIV